MGNEKHHDQHQRRTLLMRGWFAIRGGIEITQHTIREVRKFSFTLSITPKFYSEFAFFFLASDWERHGCRLLVLELYDVIERLLDDTKDLERVF